MRKTWVKASGFVCALWIALAAYAFSFSPADLAGDWKFYNLAIDETSVVWERITAAMDEGSADGDWEMSDGNSGLFSETGLSINEDGFIAVSGRDDFAGAMNPGKNTIVLTDSRSDGKAVLGIGLKVAGSFSDSDLGGGWNIYVLASDGESPVWQRTALTIEDSQAAGTWIRSDGEEDDSFNIELDITADGIITVSGTDFEGKMDSDKNLFAFNDKQDDGMVWLGIGVKTGGAFSTPDLKGLWEFSLLETSGTSAESGKTILAVDDQGHSAIQLSTGGWLYSGVVEISDDGLIAFAEQNPYFQGTMSLDKNVIVFTNTIEDTLENDKKTLGVGVKISSEINGVIEVPPDDNGNGDYPGDDEPGDGTTGDDNDNGGSKSVSTASSTCFITTVIVDEPEKVGSYHIPSPDFMKYRLNRPPGISGAPCR